MTTAVALEPRIADVVGMRDEIGILSVYVGIDPVLEAVVRPSWEIELAAALQRVRAEVRDEGRHGRRAALERCLESLTPALEHLVDASGHGRGRVAFAALGSGETHTLSTQAAFPTRAMLGAVPHVVPLLAVDDGHPLGLVVTGRDRVRVLESRLGEVVELALLDVEAVVEDGPERKGPVAANPLRAQHTVTQRERYERHVESSHRRRLTQAAAQIGRTAAKRGWELAAVAADPRSAHALAASLAEAGVHVETDGRDLDGLAPLHALDELRPVAERARSARDTALVARAREAAAGGRHGAAGLAGVVAALAEGRVDRLVLTGEPVAGYLGPAGEIVPTPPAPAAQPDPLCADRLALRALETGARVTVVTGEAASDLADADGVAALLRW